MLLVQDVVSVKVIWFKTAHFTVVLHTEALIKISYDSHVRISCV